MPFALFCGHSFLSCQHQSIAYRQHDVFDAIVTDLGLPDMPGDALIREIIGAAPYHARIVVITGYGEPYLTRARRAGADVVLTKPVEWQRVLAALQPPGLAASA